MNPLRPRPSAIPTLSPRASLAVGALSAVTLWSAAACAADPPPGTATPSPSAQAAARRTDAEQRAVDRAQQALEAKQQWIPGIAVESVTATEWSDSSLGCRQPGSMYMQVITSGYTVKFVGKDARREVHVAGDNAVVCPTSIGGTLRMPERTPRVPLRNREDMIEAARADLATRLNAKPESIKFVNWSAVRLPARVLHCEVATADPAEPLMPGYKIVLSHNDRPFTYHSDLQTVTACPRIERD